MELPVTMEVHIKTEISITEMLFIIQQKYINKQCAQTCKVNLFVCADCIPMKKILEKQCHKNEV